MKFALLMKVCDSVSVLKYMDETLHQKNNPEVAVCWQVASRSAVTSKSMFLQESYNLSFLVF